MTFKELKNKLSNEEHIISPYRDIVYGEKSDSPSILGIYEENGVWYIYTTEERGGMIIIKQGSENEMTEALYKKVLKIEKFYLLEHGIIG